MPADDGLRFDNCTEEDVGPAGPEGAEGGPEEAVPTIQRRPWSLAFEHGDLLTQTEDLEGCVAPRTEENAETPNTARNNWTMNSRVVAVGADSMPMSAQNR
jgi:hypothetical protein